jgi:hypothetical protein
VSSIMAVVASVNTRAKPTACTNLNRAPAWRSAAVAGCTHSPASRALPTVRREGVDMGFPVLSAGPRIGEGGGWVAGAGGDAEA